MAGGEKGSGGVGRWVQNAAGLLMAAGEGLLSGALVRSKDERMIGKKLTLFRYLLCVKPCSKHIHISAIIYNSAKETLYRKGTLKFKVMYSRSH